jgi:hypothetical protein
VGLTGLRFTRFSEETAGFEEMLAQMQPSQRALSMIFEPFSKTSIAPLLIHLPQWYAADKQGIVDPGFSVVAQELVVYREGESPSVVQGFEWAPFNFNWTSDEGASYRYFIVRGKEDYGPWMFHEATCEISLRFHRGDWWLYERATPCDSAPQNNR